jgi:tRNA (mo5U34)-methyltransferase
MFIFFSITIIFFFLTAPTAAFTVVTPELLLLLQSRTEQQSFTTVPDCCHDSLPSRTDPRMNVVEPRLRALPGSDLEERIAALAPWFHNIKLGGVWTAPDHFLGDYPGAKFRRFARHLPDDLAGKSVLDIGCNAGFYSIEMKRRGAARVLGIDSDERYLAQARLASETLGFDDIEFAQADVYDVGALGEAFDLVIFMGVLYHLRHPLLALDLIREHVARDMLLFQSMQRGSKYVLPLDKDYAFKETGIFFESGFPKLHFVEHQYSQDWTNWWVPNRACTEAMLRSAGFAIDKQIEEEVYLCRVSERPFAKYGPAAVYPARGAAE